MRRYFTGRKYDSAAERRNGFSRLDITDIQLKTRAIVLDPFFASFFFYFV